MQLIVRMLFYIEILAGFSCSKNSLHRTAKDVADSPASDQESEARQTPTDTTSL